MRITIESAMQSNVLRVNIDSPRSIHVMTGKIRYDVPNPINLIDHALSKER